MAKQQSKRIEDQVLVIFGASGDLTYRKLVPSLYDLYRQELLPERFAVLGVSRTKLSDEAFREKMIAGIKAFSNFRDDDEQHLFEFAQLLSYQDIDTGKTEDYSRLKTRLDEVDENLGISREYCFYLATPPSLYAPIVGALAAQGMHTEGENEGKKRVVIEKPFGVDLDSAIDLNNKVQESFKEHQIYRIDHYLGKETVQNLLVTRFSNGMFEPLWNRNYIDRVEITSAESIGIEDRGGYYDQSGALRDMFQNHLMQLLGFVAMEPPMTIDANAIRNEVAKVFQGLRPIPEDQVKYNVVRGQYTSSIVRGDTLKSYQEEGGVKENSRTETYVAIKCFVDNWRWSDVPFYVRIGKRMPTRVTEVVIHFKDAPQKLFGGIFGDDVGHDNQLIIRIQPDEGILLKFGMKVPGAGFKVQTVNMDFHYSDLMDTYVPGAYERLLLDAMQADATLYARADAVEAAWKFVDPIQKAWANDDSIALHGYPAGTWGPIYANELFDNKHCEWRQPCKNLVNDGNYCEL